MKPYHYLFFGLLILSSCIGDDLIFDEVEPTIRIINPIVSLEIGSNHQFEFRYFNNVGVEEQLNNISWTSSNPDIIEISSTGLATGLEEGTSVITIASEQSGILVEDSNQILVSDETVAASNERSGEIRTTSSYTLEGNFLLKEESGDLIIDIMDNYKASTALPGLYIYLTNNPNSTAEAFEIGAVEVFQGAHTYNLGDEVKLNDFSHLLYFCKPFNVKVGDGEIN